MAFHERLDRTLDRTLSRTSANSRRSNIRNGFYVGGSVVAPIVKGAAAASGVPGVEVLSSIVGAIFLIAQQISFNKKQSLRLAQEARKTLEALKSVIARKGEVLEKDPGFVTTVERFALSVYLLRLCFRPTHYFSPVR